MEHLLKYKMHVKEINLNNNSNNCNILIPTGEMRHCMHETMLITQLWYV